ncbi:MAG: hypothetical protein K2M17_04410 [Bacilli bacterium]|nr:hypothetical protein [Bacilli bacterium]
MKSSYHIKRTEIGPVFRGEGEARSTFVKAFNQAFPLKVEEQYVALTNQICDYFATCDAIEKHDERLYFQALCLQSEYDKLEKIEALDSIQSHLNEAMSNANENPTLEACKAVSDMARYASKILEKQNASKSEIESLNNTRYEHEKSIATERGELEKIIAEISATLQAIAALNIDGERRIDRLHVSQKHFSDIDNLDITPLEKNTLKREFMTYFNMRCVAFKYIEELAEKILVAYSKREVLCGYHNDGKIDKDLEIYMIVLQTLRTFPHCNRRVGNLSRKCDEINADCEIIDIITGYLNDGTLNEEEFLNAWNSKGFDPNIGTLAMNTMFAIKRIEPAALQRL